MSNSISADFIVPKYGSSVTIQGARYLPDMTSYTMTTMAGPDNNTSIATLSITGFVVNDVVTLDVHQMTFLGMGTQLLTFPAAPAFPAPLSNLSWPIMVSSNNIDMPAYLNLSTSKVLSILSSGDFNNNKSGVIYSTVVKYPK